MNSDTLHYGTSKVRQYLQEATEAMDTAKIKGDEWSMMNPWVARGLAKDLLEAHKIILDHSCKSKFIPGVLVGAGVVFAFGAYEGYKEDKAKKKK